MLRLDQCKNVPCFLISSVCSVCRLKLLTVKGNCTGDKDFICVMTANSKRIFPFKIIKTFSMNVDDTDDNQQINVEEFAEDTQDDEQEFEEEEAEMEDQHSDDYQHYEEEEVEMEEEEVEMDEQYENQAPVGPLSFMNNNNFDENETADSDDEIIEMEDYDEMPGLENESSSDDNFILHGFRSNLPRLSLSIVHLKHCKKKDLMQLEDCPVGFRFIWMVLHSPEFFAAYNFNYNVNEAAQKQYLEIKMGVAFENWRNNFRVLKGININKEYSDFFYDCQCEKDCLDVCDCHCHGDEDYYGCWCWCYTLDIDGCKCYCHKDDDKSIIPMFGALGEKRISIINTNGDINCIDNIFAFNFLKERVLQYVQPFKYYLKNVLEDVHTIFGNEDVINIIFVYSYGMIKPQLYDISFPGEVIQFVEGGDERYLFEMKKLDNNI